MCCLLSAEDDPHTGGLAGAPKYPAARTPMVVTRAIQPAPMTDPSPGPGDGVGACRVRSQAHREIESGVLRLRDDSAEVLVDDLLNGFELLGRVVTPIRLRDSDKC